MSYPASRRRGRPPRVMLADHFPRNPGMSKRKYFGTDGIRGHVGEWPITAEFMLKLGRAAGRVLTGPDGVATVVIGKDTRISGYMFESALEAGLVAAGANVRLLGPMPTPAVAYLTRSLRASAGIVISASHNPHQDNGSSRPRRYLRAGRLSHRVSGRWTTCR